MSDTPPPEGREAAKFTLREHELTDAEQEALKAWSREMDGECETIGELLDRMTPRAIFQAAYRYAAYDAALPVDEPALDEPTLDLDVAELCLDVTELAECVLPLDDCPPCQQRAQRVLAALSTHPEPRQGEHTPEVALWANETTWQARCSCGWHSTARHDTEFSAWNESYEHRDEMHEAARASLTEREPE